MIQLFLNILISLNKQKGLILMPELNKKLFLYNLISFPETI